MVQQDPPEQAVATRKALTMNRAVEELLEAVLVDAHGDGEQLWALRQAFEDRVELPADALVIGEPVSVVGVDYDGNERRGLTAKCRRDNGGEHVVSAADVVFPGGSAGALHVAAYRKWLGLPPFAAAADQWRRHKAAAPGSNLGSGAVELVVLSIKQRAARCRLLDSSGVVTLRASGLWEVVPGHVLTVRPRKRWIYGSHAYLSGEVESARLDVPALGLEPLRLESLGLWDPEEEYWGEEHEPVEEWAVPIIAHGPRPLFEMEQVLPGHDPEAETDPIIEASERSQAGDGAGARKILMDLCQSDLRCLDAHSHLGNLAFDDLPKTALEHFEMGVRIGELSLGEHFGGVLSWGAIDNRPFLRCLHGYGLCLWRLDRRDEAASVFRRMLWLNPADNQGARFLADQLASGGRWES